MNISEPGPSPSAEDIHRLASRYRVLRAETRTFNDGAAALVEKRWILHDAQALGLTSGDTLVFPTEDAAAVLFDFSIHRHRPGHTHVVDRYLDKHPTAAGTDHALVVEAMRQACFRVMVVKGVVPGLGVHVLDAIRKETLFVADFGLSESCVVDASFAAWVVDLPEFSMTTGPILQVTRDPVISASEVFIQRHPDVPPPSSHDLGAELETELTALIIGSLLAKDRLEEVEHRDLPPHPKARRRVRTRRPARNAPCPCGSGRRFKACCGK